MRIIVFDLSLLGFLVMAETDKRCVCGVHDDDGFGAAKQQEY
ncbi:MAG: hypothetical protein ACU0B9_07455 [Limimaricola soesokkakensis]